MLAGLAASGLAGPVLGRAPDLAIAGRQRQGGFAIGRTTPFAALSLDDEWVGAASAAGWFFVGFDRDAPAAVRLSLDTAGGPVLRTLQVAPGDFDVQRISGLPADQVNPTDPALLERIRRESVLKTTALQSRLDADHFKDGFVMPLERWRVSARFGGQRILNGTPKPPHYGTDLAAGTGTPIHAPAAGVVTLAVPDMHFEGGLTMIDHGQGLTSYYLHQSRLDVGAGQTVTAGQVIGAVGRTGRVTGPHLCWRLKWRGRNLDPMLLVGFGGPR